VPHLQTLDRSVPIVRYTIPVGSHALANVSVLDLTRLLPGGLCTLVLADLGADVVKVEAPDGGDYARDREPHLPGAEATTSSASFRGLNRNKRSIVLDLKDPDGPATFLHLAETADVVLESFRPGVMDRLGVGYDALARANPGIVLCSISGWGQSGSMAQAAGHDLNYLAALGLLSFTGAPEEEPMVLPLQVADSASALFAALSILAALHERDRSGEGQRIDVSIAHSALSLASMTIAGVLATGQVKPRREGIWDGGIVCYQVYRSEDGWVALGALEKKFWLNWCDGVGRPDLIERRYDTTNSVAHDDVTAIMAARTSAEWQEFAATHDCCLTVVTGLAAALDSPLVRDRGMVRSLRQSADEPAYEALALPFIMSSTPVDADRAPAPRLGEHTRDVLENSGLSADAVERILAAATPSAT
jgi:alpha-methylacyl-CoA racemase